MSIVPAVTAMLAATTAANAANMATMNNRRMRSARAALSAKNKKINQEYEENQTLLKTDYEKAYSRALASVDKTKTVVEDSGGIEKVSTYYDAEGNILIKERALRFMIDSETTTDIYSPYTGKKVFSNCVYRDSSHEIENISHYDKDGNDDTNMYAVNKKMEEKQDKVDAKKRLLKMKLKKKNSPKV